jgi:selenocysteine lyase/cysteine desulfurase
MNPKTKMLLLTHMINLTGQILPAKEIISAAHQKGVEVLVDAAHSFAQIQWTFEDLDADYLGTSLHKWLCNTLGAGMFCIKKKHISKIWPLFGDVSLKADDVRKFEHFGTVQCAVYETIDKAIDFHLMIGPQLKEARLRYMKDYWTQKVFDMQRVSFNTPLEAMRSCAIANFKIEGLTPNALADKLYKDFKIFTVAIDHPIVKGVRVTPHLYTSIQDLDALAGAIEKIVAG